MQRWRRAPGLEMAGARPYVGLGSHSTYRSFSDEARGAISCDQLGHHTRAERDPAAARGRADPRSAGTNVNLISLLVFALVFGMGGSFISLAMSKWIAKRTTGAEVIERPRNEQERWLVETVQRQAKAAGIGMPEVAIYNAPDVNAFATGMNRNSALVAVRTGLLNSMSRDEAEAVLGYEISHVANGDMVTLALIQGVVNTFVIFLSRVIGHLVDRVVFKNDFVF